MQIELAHPEVDIQELCKVFPEKFIPIFFSLLQKDLARLQAHETSTDRVKEAAQRIANGEVIVVDFGCVVGYVCDGSNKPAREKIIDLKNMQGATHTFALITTPDLFPTYLDKDPIPQSFLDHANAGTLPQGIHYRLPSTPDVPDQCYSTDGTQKIIQMAIFGTSASPEIASLIRMLNDEYRIHFVIATSANIHGQTEVDIYGKGASIASEHKLLFLDPVHSDHKSDTIPGSFPGIHVAGKKDASWEESLQLFRPGHHLPEQIDILCGFPVPREEPLAASRFPKTPQELPVEIVQAIMSTPARLRLQLLAAYMHFTHGQSL